MKNDDVSLEAFFRQWEQVSTQVRTQLEPILRIPDSLRRSSEAMALAALEAVSVPQKAMQAMTATLEPVFAQQKAMQEAAAAIPEYVAHLAQEAAQIGRAIQETGQLMFEQLREAFAELPPRTQEALLLLGEHGWYLDLEMDMPTLWELMTALSEGKAEDAEDALVKHFADRSAEIEESIVNKFPNRGHLVRAAFDAYRRGQYELSIPVLLAQSDGICKQVAGQYLFLKRDHKPCTAIYVEQIAANGFRSALLSPLTEALAIGASEHERPTGFKALNRHMVLHGESLDYGTKINNLKAISLINYVVHVLEPRRSPTCS